MIFKAKNKLIQYCPTPKCGCTSTKVMINKGIEGVDDIDYDIHHRFNTKTFEVIDADIKFCIVRDPVSRFISSYANRICRHNDIKFVELDEFINNFHDKYYRLDESIYHHFRPQVDFIGNKPSYYNRIFFLHEMSSVCEFLIELIGEPIKLEKLQTVDAEKPIPTESQIDFIKSFYEDDYKFLDKINN